MCKKSPQAAEIEFELRHTSLKLLKSAFFVRIFAFFFSPGLSKMQERTFIKQKTNK
jgi:hypothetical protein